MAKRDSVKFFLRFLLLTIVTFVLVTASFALATMGGVGAAIGIVIVVINVLLLFYFLFMSALKLFKHIFDKEREYFDFMYVVNLLFTVLIAGVFLLFYLAITVGIFAILLPFTA
jgi:hypothetical protein